jgi:hypothetical protein
LTSLEEHHALLNDELAKKRAEIVTVSGKILTAPVEEMTKFVAQRVTLEKQARSLVDSIDDTRAKLQEKAK